MSHGSYDLNLGLKILILAGDIRLRSWSNIGGTYGTRSWSMVIELLKHGHFLTNYSSNKIRKSSFVGL